MVVEKTESKRVSFFVNFLENVVDCCVSENLKTEEEGVCEVGFDEMMFDMVKHIYSRF